MVLPLKASFTPYWLVLAWSPKVSPGTPGSQQLEEQERGTWGSGEVARPLALSTASCLQAWDQWAPERELEIQTQTDGMERDRMERGRMERGREGLTPTGVSGEQPREARLLQGRRPPAGTPFRLQPGPACGVGGPTDRQRLPGRGPSRPPPDA